MASLSLLVPGAGQIYLGQWTRGVRLFLASAAMCFGLGLCNLVVAMDAGSLARRLQRGPLPWCERSDVMKIARIAQWLLGLPFRLFGRIPLVRFVFSGQKLGG